jgi:hypothetical protein
MQFIYLLHMTETILSAYSGSAVSRLLYFLIKANGVAVPGWDAPRILDGDTLAGAALRQHSSKLVLSGLGLVFCSLDQTLIESMLANDFGQQWPYLQ